MSHNTFGHLFRVTTWGESHGPALGCVVDGCPPGIALTEADVQVWLEKRRPGQGKFVTQRQEPDAVKILSGVFSDERGDYGEGTYIRNPPRSRHAPRTAQGCIVLVKSRQMKSTEAKRVVLDTTKAVWKLADPAGLLRLPLHLAPDTGESVTLEQMLPGAQLTETDRPGGEEIFVLSGELSDRHGSYVAGTWIRNPAGSRSGLGSSNGATYWAKRGHLRPIS